MHVILVLLLQIHSCLVTWSCQAPHWILPKAQNEVGYGHVNNDCVQ